MQSKPVIIIVAAVAMAVIGGIVAGAVLLGDSDDDPVSKGVIYYGNGGVDEKGRDVYGFTESTVMESFFTRENYLFSSWNTKADGSGQTYAVGQSIDYGDGKVRLYAQWGFEASFTWSSIGSTIPLDYFIVDSGSKTVPVGWSPVPLPVDGRAAFTALLREGWTMESDWTYDDVQNKFACEVSKGANTYAIELKISVVSGTTYNECSVISNLPTMSFTYDGPVHFSIGVRSVAI